MSEIPDDETAFAHRDVNCHLVLGGGTADPTLSPLVDEWIKNLRAKFQETNGFEEEKFYVSYAHGDESQEGMYGARKLERLRALKRQWDPQQKFSWNNPIRI